MLPTLRVIGDKVGQCLYSLSTEPGNCECSLKVRGYQSTPWNKQKEGCLGCMGTERSLVLPLEPPPTLTTQTPVVPLGPLGSGGPAPV